VGGYGSTRWAGYTKRTAVEECRRLDVRDLKREGLLEEGKTWAGSWGWTERDGSKATIGLQACSEWVRLTYTLRFPQGGEPQQVSYEAPVSWSGPRPFFLCPGPQGGDCGRRVEKLYLPLYGPSGRFLCRHCWGLSYHSRQTWDPLVSYYRGRPEEALIALRSGKARGRTLVAICKALEWDRGF